MCLDKIPLYDGVYDTLEELKSQGNKIALCTSKARDTVSLIEHKLPTFDYICCPTNGLSPELKALGAINTKDSTFAPIP